MTGIALPEPGARHGAPSVRRFKAPGLSPGLSLALWAAGTAAIVIVVAGLLLGEEDVPGYRVAFRLVGGAFVACGLIAWRRRPDSRSGLLMTLTGFGLFVEPLFRQSGSATMSTLADIFQDVWGVPIVWLLLTMLNGGRLDSTLDRVLVGAFGLEFLLTVAQGPFIEQDGNFLFVRADPAAVEDIEIVRGLVVSAACVAIAAVIGARWRAASRPRRRALLPSVAGIGALLLFAVAQQAAPLWLQWSAVLSLLLVPAAFLAGLLRSRLARADLAELFGELRTKQGGALRDALAQALGDPSLVLAYRDARGAGHLDADGRPIDLPAEARVAPIEVDGREVAALAFDPSLDEDPELVEAVTAAAAIALEHAHLQDQARERLAEVHASRERIVAAGDAERRRLERNLHDGAQQRLVALAMQLRLAQLEIRSDPAAAEKLVTAAGQELALSLEELRALARGIHPAVLDHGLPAALEALTAQAIVRTALSCDVPARLPESAELAAYFVTCEALANVGKYARASSASVRVSHRDARLRVEVADDGVGGADPAGGSGLRGLADRVEALDGFLRVRSPAGRGTTVTAEIPCAS